MHDLIAPPIGDGNVAWPFACVIYLHGSTRETDIGLTLTFAHELQHFIQYAHKQRLWALNTLLTNLGSDDFKVWWDFPIEVDARRTAKLVAEELHGSRPVMEYISCRISARVTDTDADDWRFVQSIDTSFPYDLAERTRPLLKKYKEHSLIFGLLRPLRGSLHGSTFAEMLAHSVFHEPDRHPGV